MCNNVCLPNADLLAQKFGNQIQFQQQGITNAEKSMNGFAHTVYFPTNWRDSGYNVLMAKFPAFIRYGGLVPVAPEYFQRNYLGVYPLGQQPVVDESKPFDNLRYS